MSITRAPADPRPRRSMGALAREIGVECHRALRRLDGLISERDDVLLAHAHSFVQRAGRLNEQIVRAERRA